MLGYPTHAAYVIEDRMAKTPATVNSFLDDLRKRLAPGGAAELQKFLDLKKADLTARNKTAEIDGNFYLWDLGFYNRLMIEKDYEIDQYKVSEYFPVQSTVAAMLHIFEELLGFVFVELGAAEKAALSPTGKAGDLTWHEDVIFFSVWNSDAEGGAFVGYLYLDLHPRPGKYGHAANFNLQAGYLKRDGASRHHPATALVCNLSKPTATRPGLLRHDEVTTLFHELGHGIHDLSGRTRYSRFHGTRTVRDFVEAPSQMLENWCWTPSTLKRLSSHFETGATIPDDLIAKLISTKHVNEATTNLRQIHYGQFDMALHTPATHADAEKIDPVAIYNDMRLAISGMKGMEHFGLPRYEISFSPSYDMNWCRGHDARPSLPVGCLASTLS
jgi:metallopeptidase MepB